MASQPSDLAPALEVEVVDATLETPGSYVVAWRVLNRGSEEVSILEAWLPHSEFYADREAFGPALRLAAGAEQGLVRRVRCRPEAGHDVENAFLILRVNYAGAEWRVFARMRVEGDAAGAIRPLIEAVTTEAVGLAAR